MSPQGHPAPVQIYHTCRGAAMRARKEPSPDPEGRKRPRQEHMRRPGTLPWSQQVGLFFVAMAIVFMTTNLGELLRRAHTWRSFLEMTPLVPTPFNYRSNPSTKVFLVSQTPRILSHGQPTCRRFLLQMEGGSTFLCGLVHQLLTEH